RVQAPLQDWGEETEDGAVYSVSLRRQRSQRLSPGERSGGSQAPSPAAEAFLHYRTSKVRALRAARLERLVRELVSGDREQDPGFVPAFLATHRAFVPTARVLGLLWSVSTRTSKFPALDSYPDTPLRLAVVSVLGSWLRDHPQDFRDPPAHSDLGNVCTFLGWAAPGGAEAREAKRLLGDFLEEAEQELEEEEQPDSWAGEGEGLLELVSTTPTRDLFSLLSICSAPSPPPSPVLTTTIPPPLDLKSFYIPNPHPLILRLLWLHSSPFYKVAATSLFLVTNPSCFHIFIYPSPLPLTKGLSPLPPPSRFHQLIPSHYLGSEFFQVRGETFEHLWSMLLLQSKVFVLAARCLVLVVLEGSEVTGSKAGLAWGSPIWLPQRCRELRNFSSLRAILSALQSNPIYRLKRSWGAVSREPLSTFRKLSQIFSDENNHLSSREILSQEDTPQGSPSSVSDSVWDEGQAGPSRGAVRGPVPYLGTFLTDLVMLDTALPDMLEGDLINFEKRRKEWEILAQIQQLQRRCQSYCLSPRLPILAALRAQRQLSEEQSYGSPASLSRPSCSDQLPTRRATYQPHQTSQCVSLEVCRGDVGSGSCPERKVHPLMGAPGTPHLPPPGSPPSSPKTKDPPPGNPPASPGPQGPTTKYWPLGQASASTPHCLQLHLSPDLPGPWALTLPLSGPHIPLPGRQSSDARVIRVSVDNDHGNLYRSILLTSQDKAPSVVQRALQKHNVVQPWARDYQLFQVLPGDRELLIPDNANVFYAMSPAAPGDFVLRRK
uniref:Ral guanine nucleotide dissociation stimulator like 3 n=1 Tax=Loxodonta africana TaxID=9785 RepID=G3TV63_LOXAF